MEFDDKGLWVKVNSDFILYWEKEFKIKRKRRFDLFSFALGGLIGTVTTGLFLLLF